MSTQQQPDPMASAAQNNEFVKEGRWHMIRLWLLGAAVLALVFGVVLAFVPETQGTADLRKNAQTGCFSIASLLFGYVVGQGKSGK